MSAGDQNPGGNSQIGDNLCDECMEPITREGDGPWRHCTPGKHGHNATLYTGSTRSWGDILGNGPGPAPDSVAADRVRSCRDCCALCNQVLRTSAERKAGFCDECAILEKDQGESTAPYGMTCQHCGKITPRREGTYARCERAIQILDAAIHVIEAPSGMRNILRAVRGACTSGQATPGEIRDLVKTLLPAFALAAVMEPDRCVLHEYGHKTLTRVLGALEGQQ